MSKTVYFISGLGMDERIFYPLNLPEINRVYIQWVQPLEEDTIATYAKKLLPQIDVSQPIVIVGYSFGGMLATELSQLIPTAKIILLSSAVTASAIPNKYQVFRRWKVIDRIPFRILRRPNAPVFYIFGIKSKQNKTFFKEVMQTTDEHRFKWTVKAIQQWDNEIIPKNVIQIHGTKDLLLPLIPNETSIKIEGGGHFMLLEQVEEVSTVLQSVLKNKIIPV